MWLSDSAGSLQARSWQTLLKSQRVKHIQSDKALDYAVSLTILIPVHLTSSSDADSPHIKRLMASIPGDLTHLDHSLHVSKPSPQNCIKMAPCKIVSCLRRHAEPLVAMVTSRCSILLVILGWGRWRRWWRWRGEGCHHRGWCSLRLGRWQSLQRGRGVAGLRLGCAGGRSYEWRWRGIGRGGLRLVGSGRRNWGRRWRDNGRGRRLVRRRLDGGWWWEGGLRRQGHRLVLPGGWSHNRRLHNRCRWRGVKGGLWQWGHRLNVGLGGWDHHRRRGCWGQSKWGLSH